MSVASQCCPCFCVVLCVSFCTGHFVMLPLNLTYLHCLQRSLFEHLFNLFYERAHQFYIEVIRKLSKIIFLRHRALICSMLYHLVVQMVKKGPARGARQCHIVKHVVQWGFERTRMTQCFLCTGIYLYNTNILVLVFVAYTIINAITITIYTIIINI